MATPENDNRMELPNRIKRIPNEGLFMSVTKKAEKITTALYMLTDLIPDHDPMRQQIRTTALGVLSDTRTLTYALTGDLYFHVGKIISRSWELVSLIEVCVVVGFISDMNYNILKGALIDFISDLRNKQRIEGFKRLDDMKIGEGEATHLVLNADFFKLSPEEAVLPGTVSAVRGINKRHIEPTMSFTKKPASHASSAPASGTDRREKLLALVREKRDIAIKDILSFFADVSSKTVLRDLNMLVEEGMIRRVGERRWSRYLIVG